MFVRITPLRLYQLPMTSIYDKFQRYRFKLSASAEALLGYRHQGI